MSNKKIANKNCNKNLGTEGVKTIFLKSSDDEGQKVNI